MPEYLGDDVTPADAMEKRAFGVTEHKLVPPRVVASCA
jgi:hypothetical protein